MSFIHHIPRGRARIKINASKRAFLTRKCLRFPSPPFGALQPIPSPETWKSQHVLNSKAPSLSRKKKPKNKKRNQTEGKKVLVLCGHKKTPANSQKREGEAQRQRTRKGGRNYWLLTHSKCSLRQWSHSLTRGGRDTLPQPLQTPTARDNVTDRKSVV